MAENGPQPALKLFYSPRACSLACHIALEESGLDFEAVEVRIADAAHKEPEYLAINPLGKVPALAVDSEVLTEAHAILTFVADLVPERNLIPRVGTLERARAHEWMNFCTSTIHIAFRTVFRPYLLVGEEVSAEAAKAFGRKNLKKVMTEIERRLEDRDYALGDAFSVCDAYLFVFYLWSHDPRLEMECPAGPLYRAFGARVGARTAVTRATDREGIQLPEFS